MAKAKKVKEVKPKVEEIVEPIIEEAPVAEIGQEPPSVTLDEVNEIETVEVAEIKVVEPVSEPVVKTQIEPSENISMEDKVLKYLEGKPVGEIRMNDFLKSLFKPPKFGELPLWQHQSANKEIRNLLDKLHRSGDLEVSGNAHLKLGAVYYPDTVTMKTSHHDLNSVPIFVKKVN